jgi:glycosyltransferase involved in cell wall biosynthesis
MFEEEQSPATGQYHQAVSQTAFPTMSVIIPCHNGAAHLPHVFAALRKSTFQEFEVIVVNDRSTDATLQIAKHASARVINNLGQRGPGGARNAGVAAAKTGLLVFLDADVTVHPDTLSRINIIFGTNRDVHALFGSYDDQPADRSLISSFKNLMHHHVHHLGNSEAETFWTGCGAVRKDVFEAAGGFASTTLTCVEDIEYGNRLREKGCRILLCPEVQVKHHKKWTLFSLIRTDMLVRGIPWTVMMLRRGKPEKDLNLSNSQKVAAIAACLFFPALLLAALQTSLVWVPALLGGVLLWLNRSFYSLLVRCRGIVYAASAFPVHLLYYHYSMMSLALGFVVHLLTRRAWVAGGKCYTSSPVRWEEV